MALNSHHLPRRAAAMSAATASVSLYQGADSSIYASIITMLEMMIDALSPPPPLTSIGAIGPRLLRAPPHCRELRCRLR